MSFKKINLITVSALLFISFINAQDRLEIYQDNPYNKYGDYDGLKKYYNDVEQILFKNTFNNSETKYLVIPNFKKEYALSLSKNEITFSTVSNSIWYSRDDSNSNIKLIEKVKKIDSTNCLLINSLIHKSLKESKKAKKENSEIDGTSYYFIIKNKKATIWSPKLNTRTRNLVDIMEEIVALVKDENIQTIKFSADLTERIKKLLRK